MLLLFVIVSLLSSFLHLTLLLLRLFLFRQLQQQAGHERKEPDGRDGIYVGDDINVGRHGGMEGADGTNGCVIFYVFVLLDVLFYSYHSSSFPIISFSMEYNNRRAGQDRWQRMTGRGSRQARQVRLLLQFFFLLFSFLLLTFIISFVANYSNRRGDAKWDGIGRDGAATALRDGGQAGARRREEKGGRRADGEHGDS